MSQTTNTLSEDLTLQGLLLSDNELLIFKDEKAEYHVLSKKPYNPDKKYETIFMTWEDLKAG